MDDRNRTARSAPGMLLHDAEPQPDMARMRAYRLGRFQAELRKRDLGGALLFDSVNIRYASGTRNGAIFNFHTPSRALFVPPEGKTILYDQAGWAGPVLELGTVGEVHDMPTFSYFYVAERGDENAGRMAAMVEDALTRHAGGNKRLAVDRIEASLIAALQRRGIELADAQGPAERARIVKSADEIACILTSITVAETGIARMSDALRPGLTENELFSILHQTNIANGGDWCEYRLMASGARTNPWGQECSDKVIRAGELVAFDTGMVGRYGYATDMSRTLFCEPGKPTAEQRRLYAIAFENLHANLELVRAGLGFREFAEKAWVLPDEFVKHRYPTPIHGIGMTDEWPMVKHLIDWEEHGYDGVFEAGMTVSVESFIGSEYGVEGVKLEEQILITETGYQRLSTYPYDDRLLG
jgi:Xaa-Pro dipeptidase